MAVVQGHQSKTKTVRGEQVKITNDNHVSIQSVFKAWQHPLKRRRPFVVVNNANFWWHFGNSYRGIHSNCHMLIQCSILRNISCHTWDSQQLFLSHSSKVEIVLKSSAVHVFRKTHWNVLIIISFSWKLPRQFFSFVVKMQTKSTMYKHLSCLHFLTKRI